MAVHAGAEAEYERRHRPIWRDLEQVLLDHGVRTYSIFIDPASCDLFAYVEVESDERWLRIADTGPCRRWWTYMRDVMPTNADDSPSTRALREVFHLEPADRTPGQVGAPAPAAEPTR